MHFPFCETKCHYCDFYSLGAEKTKPTDPVTFETALIQEIELYGNEDAFAPTLSTIFMGGGTPSMTPPKTMEKVFEALFKYTNVSSETEWTMEANPSSIELNQFKAYRSLGVNRVSMGVQSLKNDHLKTLGRVHDEERALKALNTVFEAGFKNVSTDFLCGVPDQSLKDLEAGLARILEFPITHLSCYLLTLPKHHSMYSKLPHEDQQLEQLLFIDAFLTSRGFEHYEISNFAKSTGSYRAKHNLVYWKNEPYLGLGPSAHSYSGTARFKNFSSLHAYARALSEKKLPIEWKEELNLDQTELEKWMLAIRLDEGFPTEWLVADSQKKWSEIFTKEGLLKPHPNKPNTLVCTPKGFALTDSMIKKLAP